MVPNDLLLTAAKLAELTAALANTGVADPLQTCIDEAVAEVARYTAGYTLATEALNGFRRTLALHKAYTLAGPVPEELNKAHDAALKELRDIAAGLRPNLPVAANAETVHRGRWGSSDNILSES